MEAILVLTVLCCLSSSLEKGQPYIFRVGSGQVFLNILTNSIIQKCVIIGVSDPMNCNTPGVYHHNYKINPMINMIVSTKSA